jgi:hypothetical protein
MGLFDMFKKTATNAAANAAGLHHVQHLAHQAQHVQNHPQNYAPQNYAPQNYAPQHHGQQIHVQQQILAQVDPLESGRDYALEATDNSAGFDLMNRMEDWYLFRMNFEEAMGNDDRAKSLQLLQQWGIRDITHYYQVNETVNRFVQSPGAQQRYGGMSNLVQMEMNVRMKASHGALRQQFTDQGNDALLLPIEGVSLQTWAALSAKFAQGGQPASVLGPAGLDDAKWQRVNNEWMDRMSKDHTHTISQEYAKGFAMGSSGAHAGAAQASAAVMGGGQSPAGREPISIETWVEAQIAMSAASQRGQDPSAALAKFNMTVVDWSNASMWWSTHFATNAMLNGGALHQRFSQLDAHFRQQYGV